MTYAELLQKYDLLRAVAEAAQTVVDVEGELIADNGWPGHFVNMYAALKAAKDGGAL